MTHMGDEYSLFGNAQQMQGNAGAETRTSFSSGIKKVMCDDLRRDRLEKWCRKHGRKVKFELKDKIALRKWFYTLDADGSGEVNADELHDPMLSTGILRTKHQVFSTLHEICNSSSVDFESFQKAILHGQFADKKKLRTLQGFCENRYGFNVDTLFSMERRKLLYKAIVEEHLAREAEVDSVWLKNNSTYDSKLVELRAIEENQANKVVDLDSYIDELHEALSLNKTQRSAKQAHASENNNNPSRKMKSKMQVTLPELFPKDSIPDTSIIFSIPKGREHDKHGSTCGRPSIQYESMKGTINRNSLSRRVSSPNSNLSNKRLTKLKSTAGTSTLLRRTQTSSYATLKENTGINDVINIFARRQDSMTAL